MLAAVSDFKPAANYALTTYFNYHATNHFRAAVGIRNSRRDPLNASCSLDDPVSDEYGETTKIDMLDDKSAQTAFENVETVLFREQLRAVMTECMDTLPEAERGAIEKYYYSGLTFAQIDKINGKAPATARVLIDRGLVKLRNHKNRCRLKELGIIERVSYRMSGLTAFNNMGMSSVEYTVEKLIL